MIAAIDIDLSAMISHRYALDDFHAALAKAANPAESAKVMLTFA